jgi:hypothetical protein
MIPVTHGAAGNAALAGDSQNVRSRCGDAGNAVFAGCARPGDPAVWLYTGGATRDVLATRCGGIG